MTRETANNYPVNWSEAKILKAEHNDSKCFLLKVGTLMKSPYKVLYKNDELHNLLLTESCLIPRVKFLLF